MKNLGSNLVVRHESPLLAIKDLVVLCQNTQAPVTTIVYQKEVTSEEIDIENKIQAFCKETDIEAYPTWGLSLYHKYGFIKSYYCHAWLFISWFVLV